MSDVVDRMRPLVRSRTTQVLLAGMGLLALGLVLVALLTRPHATARGHQPSLAGNAGGSTSALRSPVPSEPPPTAAPTAAGPTPPAGVAPQAVETGARVRIPELSIDLPIVHGDGVNAPLYQAVQAPELSPLGSGQRAMLYAHAQAGMFGNLLLSGRVGDHVDIELVGGRTLHYVIRQYYKRWPISDTRWLQPLNRNQVILTTCTSYNLRDPRVVAVAEAV